MSGIISMFPGGGGKKVVTGSFLGNNTNTQSITGLMFEPVNIVIYLTQVYAATSAVGYMGCIDGNYTVAQANGMAVSSGNLFAYAGGTLTMTLSSLGYKFDYNKTYRYILTE